MVVGYVLIGTISGLSAFLVALLLGASFWSALMLYGGVSALATITVPMAQVVVERLRNGAPASAASNQASIDLHRPSLKMERAHVDLSEQDCPATMKILAVDDGPTLRELLPMIAVEADFPDITTVSSGDLALDAIAKADTVFDCLLLDISMSDMDGIQLCARIRELPAYRQTPIIILPAMREMGNLDRAFDAGATDFVTKPFDVIGLDERFRAAQEDILSRQQVVTTHQKAGMPSLEVSAWKPSDPVEAISFKGIAGFIDFTAIGGYLTRLSRKIQERVTVIQIKVDQIETIYSLAFSEKLSALREKADSAPGANILTKSLDLRNRP